MNSQKIEKRLQDINNEIYSLDSLRDAYDDTNIHEIEHQVDSLLEEKYKLTVLLESFFDDIIGL